MFEPLFLILVSAILSAGEIYPTVRVDNGNELSNSSVYSISQDGAGNMWFSTEDGLVRYDGYDFHLFETASRRATLMTDSSGCVWAVRGKAYVIDIPSCTFHEISGFSTHYLWDMEQFADDLILFATDEGIKAVNPLTRCVCEVPDFLKDVPAVEFFIEGDTLYVCTTKGEILVYSSIEGRLRNTFQFGWEGPVNDMQVLAGQVVAVATEGHGIFMLDLNSGIVKNLSHNPGRENTIASDYVRIMCVDERGRLLAGTTSGLSVITIHGNVINSSDNDGKLSDSIKSIFADSDGGLWFGTYLAGINYHSSHGHFKKIELPNLKIRNIGCLAADADGSMWIGINNSGLANYNPATGNLEGVYLASPDMVADEITSMAFFPDGKRILIGTSLDGLKVFDKTQHTFRKSDQQGNPRSIYALCPEDGRYVWMGTMRGLFLIDSNDLSVVASTMDSGASSSPVYHLAKDSLGRLWTWSSGKLIMLEVTKGEDGKPTIKAVDEIATTPTVNDFLELDSRMWVSTNNGLYAYSLTGENVGVFLDGFSSEFLYGLQSDSSGKIWISTRNGLNCFNPKDGSNKIYYAEDGLATSFFNNSTHCLLPGGEICFGSLSGIIQFNPSEPWKDRPSHSPIVSSVSVNGNNLKPPFDRHLSLKHFQNTLSFTFSAPNFNSWGHDRFFYMLKGAGDHWQPTGKDRSVIFSDIRPGKYELEIKSINCDGIESFSRNPLSFVIHRPWYASLPAILLYAMFALAAISLLLVKVTKRIKIHHKEELAEASRMGMKESNMMKVEKYAVSPLSVDDFNFLLKVIEAINDNIQDDGFTVEALSSTMCMSRSNLHIKVKRLTGKSAIKLIWSLRFNKAVELLTRTDMPVSEVCDAVGFTSPSYFASMFKKETGVSPAAYRKLINYSNNR